MAHIKAMQSHIASLFQKSSLHVGTLEGQFDTLIAKHLPEKVHVICDINTHTALAHKLEDYPTTLFQHPPKANEETVNTIRKVTKNSEALIAVEDLPALGALAERWWLQEPPSSTRVHGP